MARTEIPGLNVRYDRDADSNKGRKNRRGKGILDIEGVGTPAPRDESSADRGKKTNSLLEAILGASGVVSTDPNLLKIQRQEAQQRAQKKADAQVKKAQKKENKQTFKQEKAAATGKIGTGLFAAILGAATGNPAVTAGGAGVAVDGMVDTLKARQNRRARRKDPYYNQNSQSRKSNASTVKEVFNLVKPIFDKGKTGPQSTAEAPKQSAKKANNKSHKPNYEEDIIDGDFIVFEDIVEGEFTVVENGKS